MKKNFLTKILVITFTVSLITGLIGGALTNEYLIAYLFGQLTEKQEVEFPIVKKVIEERTYVEESSTIKAIEDSTTSIVAISDLSEINSPFKSLNSDTFYTGKYPSKTPVAGEVLAGTGIILTTDGIVATCNSLVKSKYDWKVILSDDISLNAKVVYRDGYDDIALLKIESNDYFDTLNFNADLIKTGQKVISVGAFNKVKSGIISSIPKSKEGRIKVSSFPVDFISIDYEIPSELSCSPLLNLGGELVGMTLDFDTVEQGTSYAIPVSTINEVLQNFRKINQ